MQMTFAFIKYLRAKNYIDTFFNIFFIDAFIHISIYKHVYFILSKKKKNYFYPFLSNICNFHKSYCFRNIFHQGSMIRDNDTRKKKKRSKTSSIISYIYQIQYQSQYQSHIWPILLILRLQYHRDHPRISTH